MSEKIVQLNEEIIKAKGRPAGRPFPPVPLSRPARSACPVPGAPERRAAPPPLVCRPERVRGAQRRAGGRVRAAGPTAPPEPIDRRGGATWAAARPPIGGRLAGRPIVVNSVGTAAG